MESFEQRIEIFQGYPLHLAGYLEFSYGAPLGYGCPPEVMGAIDVLIAGGCDWPNCSEGIWPFLEENPEVWRAVVDCLATIPPERQPDFLAHVLEWRRYSFGDV